MGSWMQWMKVGGSKRLEVVGYEGSGGLQDYLGNPAVALMLVAHTLMSRTDMGCRSSGPLDPGIGPLRMTDSWCR